MGHIRAEYSGEFNPENRDEREFPTFQPARKASGTEFEQMAQGMGYSRVVWYQSQN